MSHLLERKPYGPRDDALFLQELNQLSRHHLEGCAAYARVWPNWQPATDPADAPFLHVGVFKHLEFKTAAGGLRFERTLKSSATSSDTASRIPLDNLSSQYQSRSAAAILRDFLGETQRPLLVLDSSRSLRPGSEITARIAAALTLRPLASDISFLLDDPENPTSLNWDRLQCVLDKHQEVLVYGFTWMLWLAWARQEKPPAIQSALAGKRIDFVHSGGWKNMEALRVDRKQFDETLTRDLHAASRVVDYYGLVEQVGLIYPLCIGGFRHVPVWADVLVRDPYTLESLENQPGQLQLMNTLAHGAPYHSVLTEDMGRIAPGRCPCGRSGKRFDLLGRMPRAELRGCANV